MYDSCSEILTIRVPKSSVIAKNVYYFIHNSFAKYVP